MFQNLSYEDIELMFGLISVVAFFVGVVIYGIVTAIKEAKQLRKLEKQEKTNNISNN